MLRMLMPDPEIDALLALMLLHDSRRNARMHEGELVLLADQDRSLWDRDEIDEGRALLQSSLRRSRPGTYALEAAIAALHADAVVASETDCTRSSSSTNICTICIRRRLSRSIRR